MINKKSVVVAVILLSILLIGGLTAYFTDTDTKTNIFTLGDNVEIALTETWAANDGLGLHPGAVVTKAPSIVNESSTTPAYVFAEIIVPCYATTGTTANAPLFTFTANSGWTLINTPTVNQTNKTITYVYAYGTSTAMTTLQKSATTSAPVFSQVTLEPSLTSAQKETANATPNITVKAYGIQIDNLGVTSPIAIWGLF